MNKEQFLQRRIQKRVAIFIMLGGLAIGMAVGFMFFDQALRPKPQEGRLYWIFPEDADLPRIDPPDAPPFVVPPEGLPPQR